MRQQRTLWLAGGAGGVEDHGAIVEGHSLVQRRRSRRGNHLAVVLDAGWQLNNGTVSAAVGRHHKTVGYQCVLHGRGRHTVQRVSVDQEPGA